MTVSQNWHGRAAPAESIQRARQIILESPPETTCCFDFMIPSLELASLFTPYYPPDTNLVDRLRYWVLATPDTIAFRFLVDGDEEVVTLTYAELDERARAIATKLLTSGLSGERVLLLFPPGLDFITAFLGCWYAKTIPVPAYPPRRNRNMVRINAISDDAQAAAALTTRAVADRFDGNLDDAPSLNTIPWIAVDDIPLELAGNWVMPDLKGEDLALLQYTSGSTGSPKGVVLTHENVIANCRMITYSFQIGPGQGQLVSWLPLYHDMGLIGGILNPIYVGGTVTLMSPVSFLTRPIRWLSAISKYGALISGGPNFAYALCVDRIAPEECEGLDLSAWSLAFNGAEPVRADVLRRFTEKFAPYGFQHRAHYPCYGMAETTLLVTGGDPGREPIIRYFDRNELTQRRVAPLSSDDPAARALVGCGQVVPGESVLIVDPDSARPLPHGQIGEIWIHSPSVGLGYWQKPEITAATFHAQVAEFPGRTYLRTGDLGFFDGDELFVNGRLKDLILVRGVNRYPQDIEETVEQCSPRLRVGSAAAFAIEHADREELVIVCEVDRQRDDFTWDTLLHEMRSAVTAEHDLPPDVIVLVRANSVPKTSSGKVQRHACREKYLEQELLVVAQWNSAAPAVAESSGGVPLHSNGKPLDEAERRVVALVMKQIRHVARERAHKLDLDTNIVVDLGLDSLERLNIAAGLERTFGGRIPDDVLHEVETVWEVAQAIMTHIGSAPVVAQVIEHEAAAHKAADTPIPSSYYEIDKMPEFARVQQLKQLLNASGIRNPFFGVHQGLISDTTRIDGRELISFSSYNYLGLSGHPDVVASAKQAIDEYGTSASASRMVSGEKQIHRIFEAELAEWLSVEDVITFAGGHATNESVIGHLVGPGDMIIHDNLAHNSIIQGAELSGARRRPFEHNNWQQLDAVLREIRHEYRRVLIAIEGLYSMDGDYPDLPQFVDVKNRHKCWLYVDEAHSIGTLGHTGRGLAELQNVARSDVEVWMGTLSKSFGSCGGFIAGSKMLVEFLRYTTPGFVYAAGLPPPNVGAALGSLRVMRREPERVAGLRQNAQLFLELAKAAGLDTGPSHDSPIIPVITGDSILALKLSEALFHAGINAQPILHPAVEESKARIRFFLTSKHTEDQIRFTVDTLAKAWRELVLQSEVEHGSRIRETLSYRS